MTTATRTRTLIEAQNCVPCKRMGLGDVWLFVQRNAVFTFTPSNNSFAVDFDARTVTTICRKGHVHTWTVDTT